MDCYSIIILLFSLAFSACSGQPSPGTVQLDLVFPRNQSTYQPTYPFPVVFAIHNSSILWPIHWTFEWWLTSLTRTANGTALESIDSGQILWEPSPTIPKSALTAADPWLLIYSVRNLVNSTSTRFSLRFSLTINRGCQPNGAIFEIDGKNYSRSARDIVFFNLSRNGDLPDVGLAGPCASPIGAISFNDTLKRVMEAPCPVQPELSPIKDCAYRIDHTTYSGVEENMLAASSCNGTGLSWPNTTGLVGPCKKSSGAEDTRGLKDGWRAVFGAICVGIFGLLL
ncbi:hypothetical protein B0T21DRAFT_362937 [Apiosordaria backusii]|uniref:DUF7136 domain-containing protein n=1 Tax=Apiosordaria backusii TaxID=314023 RepID=A0AA40BSQ7_9PEZI|nr:hypothetical protein B0T21DRAFT_362937 [Apiosordaria backusii]